MTILENLEATLEAVQRLLMAGEYAEAEQTARRKCQELRGQWGHVGKNQTEQWYINQFNALRAHACRRRMGVVIA